MKPSFNKFVLALKSEIPNSTIAHGKPPIIPDMVVTTSASSWFGIYVIALHTLAFISVWVPVSFPWYLSLLALPPLLFNCHRMFKEAHSSALLHWHGSGQIELVIENSRGYGKGYRKSQAQITGNLSPGSMQCYFFVLIAIRRPAGSPRHYLIVRDAVSTRDYRRLRSRLYLAARMPATRYR